jgi:hypothetical protein
MIASRGRSWRKGVLANGARRSSRAGGSTSTRSSALASRGTAEAGAQVGAAVTVRSTSSEICAGERGDDQSQLHERFDALQLVMRCTRCTHAATVARDSHDIAAGVTDRCAGRWRPPR